MSRDEQELQRRRELIEREISTYGYPVKEWGIDEDGDVQANLGRFRVITDDEDFGLFEGDEGVVFAGVVGAAEYNNEGIAFSFQGDDFDSGLPLRDLSMQVEGI